MKTINLGLCDIYPDFEAFPLDEFRSFLGKYKITVNFLFDDGLEFTYDETEVEWKRSPNNGGFYDICGNLIFTIIDDFGEIDIENLEGKTLFSIPVLSEPLNINIE